MFKGFYTVGSGMIAQQRRTELLSNNLANAKTPGFKEDQSSIRSFPEMLLSRIDRMNDQRKHQKVKYIGDISTGVYMQETLPNFVAGSLYKTGLSTDVAINDSSIPVDPATGKKGALFFRTMHPDGSKQYTRNGSFTIDEDGYLIASNGNYVLDQADRRMYLAHSDFTIDTDGRITQNAVEIGKLGVSYAHNPKELIKGEDGFFIDVTGQMQQADEIDFVNYQLRRGYLEASNVDETRTMTDMIAAYRAFEANSKVLQAYDRSMEKAVELGRIQ